MHLEWQMTPKTEPQWNVQGCYITTIEGDPMIVNRHMIFPATGQTPQPDGRRVLRIAGHDHHRHAGPQRHAIGMRRASPGLLTSADLPLRAFAGRFHGAPPPATR